jgi:hypothetical protein
MRRNSDNQYLQIIGLIGDDLVAHRKYPSRRVYKSSRQIKKKVTPRDLVKAFWYQFKEDFHKRMDELVYLNENNLLSDHEFEIIKKHSLVMGGYFLDALQEDVIQQKTILVCAKKMYAAQQSLAAEIEGLNKNKLDNRINAITTLKEIILDIRFFMFSVAITKEAVFVNPSNGLPIYSHRPIKQAAKEAFFKIMHQHVAENGPRSRPREKTILRRLEELGHRVSERTLRNWKSQSIKNYK